MDTQEFIFDFEAFEITTNEIATMMGFDPLSIPEPFPELIQNALIQAKPVCKPTGGFRIFSNCALNKTDNTIRIENQLFRPDKIVISQLKEMEQIAIYVCTAGSEITELSNQYLQNGDSLTGFVFDILGSITAEKTAIKLQAELEKMANTEALNISDRFSPGYCQWSVAEQQQLFSLLPPYFCGVKLSASSLMWPIKSTSGIIGIGKNLSQKGYQCHWCTDKDCFVGKINRMKKD
jgi:hypothetical protein